MPEVPLRECTSFPARFVAREPGKAREIKEVGEDAPEEEEQVLTSSAFFNEAQEVSGVTASVARSEQCFRFSKVHTGSLNLNPLGRQDEWLGRPIDTGINICF